MSAAQALTGSIAANTVQKWLRAWHSEGVPDAVDLEIVRQMLPSTPYGAGVREIKAPMVLDIDSCEGMLVRNPKDTAEWGIFYNGKASPERRRFTIAHELGHFILHRGQRQSFNCDKESVYSGIDTIRVIEREADDFASLSQEDEEYFWRNFAASDGVRLTIDITAKNPNFRKIVYEPKPGAPIPLLTDLVSTIRQRHGREFVLQGISRLCAFYLCGQTYSREKEYRALFKAWPDFGPQPVGTGPTSYVEVPLNQMTDFGYEFRITEVHASKRPNMPDHYCFNQRIS